MALLTLRVQTAAGQTTKNAPLTNAEIDNNFINLDTDIQTRVLKAGDTLTGKLTFTPSTTTSASARIDAGTAPTTPVSGDIWATSTGLFYRLGATSQQIVLSDTSGNITLSGDLVVNGGDITTTATTASLFNTAATTINIGGAGSSIIIGAADSGTLTLRNNVIVLSGSGAIDVPTGTTAQRPTASQGMIRYNTTLNTFEGYDGIAWGNIGGNTGNSSTITLTASTTNESSYITFSSAATGANDIKTSTLLRYNQSTGVLSATDFNSTSDRNLKKDVLKISGALGVIDKLQGYTFKYKANDATASGVIAQEIEEVLPHIVSDRDGIKNVSYNQIIAYLIEGIKEQQTQISALSARINTLENN